MSSVDDVCVDRGFRGFSLHYGPNQRPPAGTISFMCQTVI